jgi:hypothetical protein
MWVSVVSLGHWVWLLFINKYKLDNIQKKIICAIYVWGLIYKKKKIEEKIVEQYFYDEKV